MKHLRISCSARHIFLLTLVILFPFSLKAEEITLTVQNSWRFSLLDSEFPYGCYYSDSETPQGQPGIILPNEIAAGSRYKSCKGKCLKKKRSKLKNKSSKLKAKLERADTKRKRRKLKKRIRTLKKKIRILKRAKSLCLAFTPDAPIEPTATALEVSAQENSPTSVVLSVSNPSNLDLTFTITQQPQHGTISGTAPDLIYTPDSHYLGADSILFEVTSYFGTVSSQASITINPEREQFAGHKHSLEPYRETLTPEEVQHLMGKVMGGNNEFREITNLNELVEAIINFEGVGAPEEIPLDENNRYRWDVAQNFWILNIMKGNVLRETIALHLFDWIPSDLREFSFSDSRHQFVRDYIDLMRDNALPRVEEGDGGLIWGEQTDLGSYKRIIHSLINDGAMLEYLDNKSNTAQAVNENYGRELMELFTGGTTALVTGAETFHHHSVVEASRSATGYNLLWDNGTVYPHYFPERHDNGEKQIFPGKPWELQGNFNHAMLINHIFENNQEFLRYMAGQWFARFVHTDILDIDFLDQLVEKFKEFDFNISEYITFCLKTSAAFSPEARKKSAISPFEAIMKFLRVTGLPVNSGSTLWAIRNYVIRAGFDPFRPPSVFGRREAGAIRNGKPVQGEAWITPQRLLARDRMLKHVLCRLYIYEPAINESNCGINGDEDNRYSYYLAMAPEGSYSSEDLVRSLAYQMDVPLRDEEVQTILNYTGRFQVGDGGISPPDSVIAQKIEGTLNILYNHPLFHLN